MWSDIIVSFQSCFVFWRDSHQWARFSSLTRFLDHKQRRITVGRTPLDEWSARRRNLYLITHNSHKRQTSMVPVGFQPTISAGKRPHTYALDRAATGTGFQSFIHSCTYVRTYVRTYVCMYVCIIIIIIFMYVLSSYVCMYYVLLLLLLLSPSSSVLFTILYPSAPCMFKSSYLESHRLLYIHRRLFSQKFYFSYMSINCKYFSLSADQMRGKMLILIRSYISSFNL
jgi:hypothetical protein